VSFDHRAPGLDRLHLKEVIRPEQYHPCRVRAAVPRGDKVNGVDVVRIPSERSRGAGRTAMERDDLDLG